MPSDWESTRRLGAHARFFVFKKRKTSVLGGAGHTKPQPLHRAEESQRGVLSSRVSQVPQLTQGKGRSTSQNMPSQFFLPFHYAAGKRISKIRSCLVPHAVSSVSDGQRQHHGSCGRCVCVLRARHTSRPHGKAGAEKTHLPAVPSSDAARPPA